MRYRKEEAKALWTLLNIFLGHPGVVEVLAQTMTLLNNGSFYLGQGLSPAILMSHSGTLYHGVRLSTLGCEKALLASTRWSVHILPKL